MPFGAAYSLFSPRPLAAVVLACVLLFSSCTSWQPSPLAPRDLLEAERPSEVRVTTSAGDQFVVVEPQMSGDSLASRDTAVLAPADIRTLEVRRFSTSKTIGLLALLAGTYALVGVALAEGWIGSGFR